MTTAFVVITPFNGYAKGEIITDSLTCDTIAESEFAHCVVKIMIPA